MKAVLSGNHPQAEQLRESFQQVLPRMQTASSAQRPEPAFYPIDGETHLRQLLETDEDEAMVYLRRILLRSSYPVEQKIEFLQNAIREIPNEEAETIVRIMLTGNIEPELYREALRIKLSSLEGKPAEDYIRQLYNQIYDKKLKLVIVDEAKALGVEL